MTKGKQEQAKLDPHGLGEIVLLAVALYVSMRTAKEEITRMDTLRGLRLYTKADEERDEALRFFDITVASEGDDYARAWLARHEPTRKLCREYRASVWKRLKPTDADIKRETSKWKRECATGKRQEGRA